MMAKSAKAFRASITTPFESTAAMRIGTIVHKLLLGGRSLTVYEAERRGNAWKEFKAANPGKEIVTVKEVARAQVIADEVLKDARVTSRLAGKTLEQSIAGKLCGVDVAGTPDAYDADTIIDVKTTADASIGGFQWQAKRMAYPIQLVWYADMLRSAGLADVKTHLLIAIETKAPFDVTIHELEPITIITARRQYTRWLEQVIECERTGVWPGYAAEVQPLTMVEEVNLIFGDEQPEAEAAE